MKFAYFTGCKIPYELEEYGLSFEAVMKKLSVQLVTVPFNCCGYPAKSRRLETSVLSAVRNLALAQKHGLDIITPCKCCFGQFKHAIYFWNRYKTMREKINTHLENEGLFWNGQTRVRHLLSFLHEDVGLAELKRLITNPFSHEKIVVQYGCHALRPFSITGFDDPWAPQIFEALLEITGFEIVEWSKKTACCGNPIFDTNKKLSLKLLGAKLKSVSDTGVTYVCNACTHCQIQYNLAKTVPETAAFSVTPLLVTQVLGMAMGIEPRALGMNGTR